MDLGKRIRRLCGVAAELLRRLPGVGEGAYTPEERLMRAICEGKLEKVERYLDYLVVDVNAAITLQPFWVLEPCSHSEFASPVTPLAVAVSLTAPEPMAARVAQALVRRGALPSLNNYWHDHTGHHTCLSKALQRGFYTLAEQLMWLGANPNILPSTDLLISTGFSCKGVRWLVDHTVVASGEVPFWLASPHLVGQVVQDCMMEAVRVRQYCTSLPPAHRRLRVAALTRRARQVLLRLSAAGAPPAAKVPSLALFEEPGWQELSAAATQHMAWGLDTTHRYYPAVFKRAVRQLLLLNRVAGFGALQAAEGHGRGRGAAAAQRPQLAGQSGAAQQGSSSDSATRVCFDEHLLVCVIQQLATVQPSQAACQC